MSEIPDEYRAVLDGHLIDLRKADRFYSGRDGRRVTDEEWDEDRRRAIAGGAGDLAVPVPVSKTPPEGDTIAEVQ